MARYFDPTSADDLKLLPGELAKEDDLARLALEAESDVIGYYTRRVGRWPGESVTWACGTGFVDLGDGRGVYLKGYAEDSDHAEEGLKAAMRVTIARVLLWRLHQETHDTASSAESGWRSTSRTYREHSDAPFPRHWDRDLSTYDTRTPLWGS